MSLNVKSRNFNLFQANMLYDNHPGLEIDVHNTLVQASCKLLTAVRQVLRPTPMPGRTHYLFTLKDIVTCFQVCTSS